MINRVSHICSALLLVASANVGTAAEALRKLNLPGIKLNLEERCVDVNATVCLHKGLLELVACTKGSKEHEPIPPSSLR